MLPGTKILPYVQMSKQPMFSIGPYTFISQDPLAMKDEFRYATVTRLLPQFLAIWKAVEEATGHRWKCTSYIRNSPSHRRGQAFDLAPDIADSAKSSYAVTNGSDPVLYKRETLIRQLQTLRDIDFSLDRSNRVGIFIEPDHLHIQALAPDNSAEFPTAIVKWKVLKAVYRDSADRMKLPLLPSTD